MKKFILLLGVLSSLTIAFTFANKVNSDSYTPPRATFNTTILQEIHTKINETNNANNAVLTSPFYTIQARGTIVSDGNFGQYIPYSGWVPGYELVPTNPVTIAQRNAALKKYGSISSSRSYYIHTTQHIAYVPHLQIQGYMTVGATAYCTARRVS